MRSRNNTFQFKQLNQTKKIFECVKTPGHRQLSTMIPEGLEKKSPKSVCKTTSEVSEHATIRGNPGHEETKASKDSRFLGFPYNTFTQVLTSPCLRMKNQKQGRKPQDKTRKNNILYTKVGTSVPTNNDRKNSICSTLWGDRGDSEKILLQR